MFFTKTLMVTYFTHIQLMHADPILGLEVKGLGKHGIICCFPSSKVDTYSNLENIKNIKRFSFCAQSSGFFLVNIMQFSFLGLSDHERKKRNVVSLLLLFCIYC